MNKRAARIPPFFISCKFEDTEDIHVFVNMLFGVAITWIGFSFFLGLEKERKKKNIGLESESYKKRKLQP